jgi:hypothetical protein
MTTSFAISSHRLTAWFVFASFLLCGAAGAQRPDVNYDESKVGKYTLPDPLVLQSGEPVRDATIGRGLRSQDSYVRNIGTIEAATSFGWQWSDAARKALSDNAHVVRHADCTAQRTCRFRPPLRGIIVNALERE